MRACNGRGNEGRPPPRVAAHAGGGRALAGFAFTDENLAWAKKEITKYPAGRQASAVIAILWRVQEQHEGWVPEAAIRAVADMLEMPYIRVLEVATFYTMFQLQPVGKKAHVQVCGR